MFWRLTMATLATFFCVAVNSNIEVPVAFWTENNAAKSVDVNYSVGLRYVEWFWRSKGWHGGADGMLSVYFQEPQGTADASVQRIAAGVEGRALLGHKFAGDQFAFMPFLFLGANGQLGSANKNVAGYRSSTFFGNISALLGLGFNVDMRCISFRVDSGGGYGMNEWIWQTTASLGFDIVSVIDTPKC